jgi:hypothetical protein
MPREHVILRRARDRFESIAPIMGNACVTWLDEFEALIVDTH